MNTNKVLDLMLKTKVIPLFYVGDGDVAKKLIDACYMGGARVIEFTNRGKMAEIVFTEMISHCNANYPNLALGVGSISTVEQAERFKNLGAHFLVSPFLDEDIAMYCKKNDFLWTGGCATLSEMHTAHKWGVPLMKAFPGSMLGPGFIKAAKAPCPWLKIMPTGGVKPEIENLTSWFSAGASCVGMGSRLFVKKSDGDYDYEQITKLLNESIGVAQEF